MSAAARYDAVVLGVGGMGSAALYELARRGRRVLGIERFDVPHERGSSHGVNRIIRLAYFEHPSYVPLLRRAYERWRSLEEAGGEQLLHITGSVDLGREQGRVFPGSLRSCLEHGLPHEVLGPAALMHRFPALRVPAGWRGLYQPQGGFVLSERAIVHHVLAAQEHGAEVRAREAVREWEDRGDVVRLRTDRGSYEARTLVVTSGAWAASLPGLRGLLTPERQVMGWFQPARPALFAADALPVVVGEFDEGVYYGFPVFGIPGFKIGRFHHLGEATTADGLDRECREEDEAVLRAALERYFPEADGPTLSLRACLFTNTPDEHFIIDRLPRSPNVVVAAGFSGHGFKFSSVVGEILADLVTSGETEHEISLFRLDRFPGRG
ncbi:MAG: N-methyl-L-tryptophan oxidase [Chloroflexi bacterium]|nr:N-methyl-L-tryptophan oxidase [Chloroflexota bacterium]